MRFADVDRRGLVRPLPFQYPEISMVVRAPTRLRLGASGALLVTVAAVRTAGAQPLAPFGAPSSEEDKRTTLYHQGFDAATAGRWADARDRFAATLAIRPSAKAFFSLAQAEEQLGELGTAARDYGRAVDAAKIANEGEVVSAAQHALSALDPRVPKVRVVVSGASGANATLDGQPIAVNALVAVDPGSHRVVVTAPGMRDAHASLAISEQQRLDIPIRLEANDQLVHDAAPPPAPPGPPPASASASPAPDMHASGAFAWRTVGLVTAAVGAVGLGVGTYFGIDAKIKLDQSNSSGCNGNDCSVSAASTRREAISAGNTSTALLVVGSALVATGVVLWVLAPSEPGGSGVSVTPVALGPGGGLSFHGQW
jgi:hypothetical protein